MDKINSHIKDFTLYRELKKDEIYEVLKKQFTNNNPAIKGLINSEKGPYSLKSLSEKKRGATKAESMPISRITTTSSTNVKPVFFIIYINKVFT